MFKKAIKKNFSYTRPLLIGERVFGNDNVMSGIGTFIVLNEEGYNNLFKEAIPEDMIDYIDFSQVWTALSVNDGWQAVTINNETYLVTTRI